ncbi:MAG: PfkB family carbohydrate kinase [Candidatus Binataceae bacterium]
MNLLVVGAIAYDTIETVNGGARDMLGGSAAYFALAARLFTPVSVIAVVGSDFRAESRQTLADRDIDLRGLEQRPGKTLRWHGRYHADMNHRDTLALNLNVFENFSPKLLRDHRRCEYLFLGNIEPDLQARVLSQVDKPTMVAADTMSYWIENAGPQLRNLLRRINVVMLNDEEARLLSGQSDLHQAGKTILKMGPTTVIVKRGEFGVMAFSRDTIFTAPAYSLRQVVDPTGAGDSFAGAFMGYLARENCLTEPALHSAILYGSAVASFAVEQFSLGGLLLLTRDEVDARYRSLMEIAGNITV